MPPPRTSSTNSPDTTTTYSLALLSEYTHTLDSLPLDLSRNFADLRELDAVLSSSMASITSKIHTLTTMIEQGTASKDERLWLLGEIADEANRLKLGGEDKIRVACQAADNLKSHTNHLTALLSPIPGFEAATLPRNTTYPHVSSRSFAPPTAFESGRRRRGAFTSLIVASPEVVSPAKRKRAREDDTDGKVSRKDKIGDTGSTQRPRANVARSRKNDRAPSPTESLLSITSHIPHANATSSRIGAYSNARLSGSTSTNRRSRAAHNAPLDTSSLLDTVVTRHEVFHAPPSSSSSHPSLPIPHSIGADRSAAPWSTKHNPNQLEGPGMPVARAQQHPALSVAAMAALGDAAFGASSPSSLAAGGAGLDGDLDGDGDDNKTYCVCDGVSYGEMVACDDNSCEKEWFHLACVGLTVPPDGAWFCDTCKAKRNAKRGGRGGKRRAGGKTRAASSAGGA